MTIWQHIFLSQDMSGTTAHQKNDVL